MGRRDNMLHIVGSVTYPCPSVELHISTSTTASISSTTSQSRSGMKAVISKIVLPTYLTL